MQWFTFEERFSQGHHDAGGIGHREGAYLGLEFSFQRGREARKIGSDGTFCFVEWEVLDGLLLDAKLFGGNNDFFCELCQGHRLIGEVGVHGLLLCHEALPTLQCHQRLRFGPSLA